MLAFRAIRVWARRGRCSSPAGSGTPATRAIAEGRGPDEAGQTGARARGRIKSGTVETGGRFLRRAALATSPRGGVELSE